MGDPPFGYELYDRDYPSANHPDNVVQLPPTEPVESLDQTLRDFDALNPPQSVESTTAPGLQPLLAPPDQQGSTGTHSKSQGPPDHMETDVSERPLSAVPQTSSTGPPGPSIQPGLVPSAVEENKVSRSRSVASSRSHKRLKHSRSESVPSVPSMSVVSPTPRPRRGPGHSHSRSRSQVTLDEALPPLPPYLPQPMQANPIQRSRMAYQSPNMASLFEGMEPGPSLQDSAGSTPNMQWRSALRREPLQHGPVPWERQGIPQPAGRGQDWGGLFSPGIGYTVSPTLPEYQGFGNPIPPGNYDQRRWTEAALNRPTPLHGSSSQYSGLSPRPQAWYQGPSIPPTLSSTMGPPIQQQGPSQVQPHLSFGPNAPTSQPPSQAQSQWEEDYAQDYARPITHSSVSAKDNRVAKTHRRMRSRTGVRQSATRTLDGITSVSTLSGSTSAPTTALSAPTFVPGTVNNEIVARPTVVERPPGGFYWGLRLDVDDSHSRSPGEGPVTASQISSAILPIQLYEPPLSNCVPVYPQSLEADQQPRPRKKSKYTAEQDRLILELKRNGETWAEIARKTNCDNHLAARNRYQVLIGQQGGGTFFWTAEDVQALQSLLDEGERAKWYHIAEELSKKQTRHFTMEMCHYKIAEMFAQNPEQFDVFKTRDPNRGGAPYKRRTLY